MLKNMNIGPRLGIGFAIMFLLLFAVCAAGCFGMGSIVYRIIASQKTDGEIAQNAAQAQAEIAGLRQLEKDILLSFDASAKRQNYFATWTSQAGRAADTIAGLEAAAATEQDRQIARELKERYASYTAEFTRVYGMIQSGAIRDMQAAVDAMAASTAVTGKMETLVKDLAEEGGRRVAQETERIRGLSQRLSWLMLGIVLAGLVIAVVLGSLITLSITRPIMQVIAVIKSLAVGDLSKPMQLRQNDEAGVLADCMRTMTQNMEAAVHVAERISQGDMTVQVTVLSKNDILGNALKHMVEKISATLAEIHFSANNVAAGAEQMSGTSQAMSQGATEQASSLEEISSSMNQIAAQTRQNAEHSSQAHSLAGDTKALAVKGNEHMGRMVDAMAQINESSRNISRIIKVIDEIAFQTNLLALNAAVEAARAGRHGKGFAVVADEVRSLAARSAQAARETAELIEGSVRKVGDGMTMAAATAAALREIVDAAAKMADLVGEIAAASNEQAQGVSQVTKGLTQIDQVTLQNTSHAEESASAAEELSSQSQSLQQLVKAFKLEAKLLTYRAAMEAENRGGAPQLVSGNRPIIAPAWGEAAAANAGTGPVILLDDREFGKY